VRWRLSSDAVERALVAWGLVDPTVVPFDGGVSGDVFYVRTAAGEWVAKFTYAERSEVELGLLAAEAAAAAGLRAAAPLRATDGSLSVMVEGPPGLWHPLSVMDYVPGEPLDRHSSDAPEIVGKTVGALHRALVARVARLVPDTAAFGYLAYLEGGVDPTAPPWLPVAVAQVVRETRAYETTHEVTYGLGVFDGPEILIDQDGTVGLVDFGVTQWQPVALDLAAHAVWLNADGDDPRLGQLLDAYQRVCPLALSDVAAVPVYRQVALAIYATFAAYKLATGMDRGHDIVSTRSGLEGLRQQLT
jgi:Ser/Thr protein kinase RdoA (MazF antagonist)